MESMESIVTEVFFLIVEFIIILNIFAYINQLEGF